MYITYKEIENLDQNFIPEILKTSPCLRAQLILDI